MRTQASLRKIRYSRTWCIFNAIAADNGNYADCVDDNDVDYSDDDDNKDDVDNDDVDDIWNDFDVQVKKGGILRPRPL